MLLLTKDPAVAASWLDRLPIKLPAGPSRTGAESNNPVDAEPYPAGVPYDRDSPYAPFNYARGDDLVKWKNEVLPALLDWEE